MSIDQIHKDAAEAGPQAELLVRAAEQAADRFMYSKPNEREAFINGFIDGATMVAKALRPERPAT